VLRVEPDAVGLDGGPACFAGIEPLAMGSELLL
jgi:hypothetical protein